MAFNKAQKISFNLFVSPKQHCNKCSNINHHIYSLSIWQVINFIHITSQDAIFPYLKGYEMTNKLYFICDPGDEHQPAPYIKAIKNRGLGWFKCRKNSFCNENVAP